MPTRKLPTIKTPPLDAIGRVGGLVTIALLPLGLLAVFLTRRRLRSLRDQAHATVARTAVLETQLATASAGYRQMVTQGAAAYAARLRGRAKAALWVLRIFALIVSFMVIYTFVSQLH